jgi:hypothetical protein
MHFKFFIFCNYSWALQPIACCTYVGGGGGGGGGEGGRVRTGLFISFCNTFHQCHIFNFALTPVLSEGQEGNALSDIAKNRTSVLYFNTAVGAMS